MDRLINRSRKDAKPENQGPFWVFALVRGEIPGWCLHIHTSTDQRLHSEIHILHVLLP